jgi:hypothetical protein
MSCAFHGIGASCVRLLQLGEMTRELLVDLKGCWIPRSVSTKKSATRFDIVNLLSPVLWEESGLDRRASFPVVTCVRTGIPYPSDGARDLTQGMTGRASSSNSVERSAMSRGGRPRAAR